jgi:hypothetical protein
MAEGNVYSKNRIQVGNIRPFRDCPHTESFCSLIMSGESVISYIFLVHHQGLML